MADRIPVDDKASSQFQRVSAAAEVDRMGEVAIVCARNRAAVEDSDEAEADNASSTGTVAT